jgi:hypothetical protein
VLPGRQPRAACPTHQKVCDLSRRVPIWRMARLEERLAKAFKFFHPEAGHEGYRP